jgi:hypothetical protein
MLLARLLAFYQDVRAKRRARSLRQWLTFWPVAVGLLLGACAPELRTLVAGYAHWALTAIFPFVALAGRPEIPLSGNVARALPLFVLYVQFPLEGLFVRMILKRRVTVHNVCRYVSCLHILALAQLWLVSGALSQ